MTRSRIKARIAALEGRIKVRPDRIRWEATSFQQQAARQYVTLINDGSAQPAIDAWRYLDPKEAERIYRGVMT